MKNAVCAVWPLQHYQLPHEKAGVEFISQRRVSVESVPASEPGVQAFFGVSGDFLHAGSRANATTINFITMHPVCYLSA